MLTLKNIEFSYNTGRPLFSRLNLKIKPGCIYGLLGKNGAGKSTLLNLIGGTIFPQRGTVKLFQHDATSRDKVVLQDVFLLGEDNVDYSIRASEYLKIYSTFYPHFNQDKFQAIANEWQIRYQDKLSNLSHGERKKFLIAFALATNCRLILLDEPTNGLDIPAKSNFRSLIASAIGAETSIIISTHQVR
ncbi:MAG TPA: ABC transporter ATP-binding protein, partial [Aquella sp.]|nr:ABC transporter ATP-binding protein [Aquella sp.]